MIPSLAEIAGPSERNVTLRIDRSGERALRSKHPWLFESAVREQSHAGRTGDLAVIFDRNRKFLAVGLYDPRSPIRVRLLHSGKPTPLDAEFYRTRFHELASRREHLLAQGTNGFRVVHGENDGLPGLIIDRYADTLVVKLYTPAWIPHLNLVIPEVLNAIPAQCIILRLSRESSRRESELSGLFDGQVIFGAQGTSPLVFLENRLRFECDPIAGQKTGFFLDQRENRSRIEPLAKGKAVVNVFSYTGGFSLYAARGGAKSVVSLDQSKPASAAAERNFALNQDDASIAAAKHEVMIADAFQALEKMPREGRRFDLVIIDPPSFANRQSSVDKAMASYARLVKLGLGVLRPGGTFVIASCSARIPSEDFFQLVHHSARRFGRVFQEFHRSEHAVDHPIGFPQGAYLKCLFANVR